MKIKKGVYNSKVLFLVLFCAFNSFSQNLFNELRYGNSNVGFHSDILVDSSRVWNNSLNQKRNIQISVWFPMEKEESQNLVFSDYFRFLGKKNNYNDITDPNKLGEETFFYQARHFKAKQESLENLKNWKMKSKFSANFPKSKTPTIFFANGASGHPINNVALFELFASHGFIVISFPTQGSDYKTSFRDNIKNGFENQSQDLLFVIENLPKSIKSIDLENLHFIGVSSGSIAIHNILKEKEGKIIPKTISFLDGSISSTVMIDFIQDYKIPLYTYDKIFMSARENKNLNKKLLIEPTSKTFKSILFKNLRHADFSSFPLLHRIVKNFNGMPLQKDFISTYEFLIGELLEFISEKSIINKVKINSENYTIFKN